MSEAPNCETTKPILSLQTKQKNQKIKKKNLKKNDQEPELKERKRKVNPQELKK